MKKLISSIFATALLLGVFAQNDTMFIHKGQTIYEFAIADIDSIVFYRTSRPPQPPPDSAPKIEARAGYVALVLNTVGEADVCNSLVFAGNYNGWNTNPANMAHFEPIQNYPNWWVAFVPMTDLYEGEEYMRGKPNQLNEDGSFPSSWDFQWHALMDDSNQVIQEVEVISGRASLRSSFGLEQDLIVELDADVVYIRTHAWKVNPCVEIPTYTITFNVTIPTIGTTDVVYIVGEMNSWRVNATPMNRTSNPNVWTITLEDVLLDAQYRYVVNGSWNYEELDVLTEDNCAEGTVNRRVNDRTMNDTVRNFRGITAERCW